MKYLDLTFPTPEENLACDEVLLDWAEAGAPFEVLRFWEPDDYFIVVGYSNKAGAEVNLPACQREGVPLLRRISGGGSVLQGPGCLNFSLVLKTANSPGLQSITQSNALIMENHRAALQPLIPAPIEVRGITDLALNGRKFSGNAQRRKKSFLLFHGTFLLNFDFFLVEKLLPFPSQQPDYRQNRSHRNFLMNLSLAAEEIKKVLRRFWNAEEEIKGLPFAPIQELAMTRYRDPAWNFKF